MQWWVNYLILFNGNTLAASQSQPFVILDAYGGRYLARIQEQDHHGKNQKQRTS